MNFLKLFLKGLSLKLGIIAFLVFSSAVLIFIAGLVALFGIIIGYF